MDAEKIKQLKELREGKTKAESELAGSRVDLARTKEEIKALQERRAERLGTRKKAEKEAYRNEQELSELKCKIYVVMRDIETCDIELDELNWNLSRSLFKFAGRKKLTEQIKEKKQLMTEHQKKLSELEAKKSELEKKPRYTETVDQHTKLKEKLDMESDEKQAHLSLVQNRIQLLQQELERLLERLKKQEEEIQELLLSGELTEEELNRALTEEPEEEPAAEPEKEKNPETKEEPEKKTFSGERIIPIHLSEGILYAPGEEPEELAEKLSELFSKLEEAYPDHVVVGLHANHKQLGKKVTELYRLLGYDNGNEFLAAYGYTSKRRRPWG